MTMEQMGLDRGRYDGCISMRTHDKAKAGRHADDFLASGPRETVDQLLAEMGEKLRLSDSVKLCNIDDVGAFPSMRVRKIEGACAIKRAIRL